jgi:ankyrin repeat domain-containing protein 50
LQSKLMDLTLRLLEDDQRISCFVQVLHAPAAMHDGWHDSFPREFNPLHATAYWGLDAVLAVLLRHGIDINSQNSFGQTALYLGAKGGHETAVRPLVEAEKRVVRGVVISMFLTNELFYG